MPASNRFGFVQSVLAEVSATPFGSSYTFVIESRGDVMLLSAWYVEPDIETSRPEQQITRKWFISEHATRSEIVQTALKCVLTSAEHRVRESFTYHGRRVFGPHFDVEQLAELATTDKALEVRS
jgi:hypothetical protein